MRHLCAILLVGGNGCWEVLSREPMLASRICRRVRFGPLPAPKVDADRTVAHLGLRVSADESGRLGLEPAPGRLSDGQRMALDDMAQNSMLTKREELKWGLLGVADRWLQRKEPSLFRRLEECGYVQHEEGSGWVPTESVAFSLDPDMT